MNEENKNIYISYWLLLITILVALMIVVGGLTRLTDSGLSITKWDLFTGIIPPISMNDWEESFSLYKKIPEYKLMNSSMTLSEFKVIFWWEYIHRLLGRIIGLFYFLPLLYFTFKKIINKKSLLSFYFILVLIFVQGIIGWYMVKSGLVDRTDVSHYRLSLHLVTAFIIFILLLWNYLKYTSKKISSNNKKVSPLLLNVFLAFVLLQISIGAFVSGLDAGQIYQTWPLMNQTYFPDDAKINDLLSLNAFEIPSIVQFIHRNIAYFIIILFSFIAFVIYKNKDLIYLRKVTLLVLVILSFQTILGILTILSGAQIFLASMHQIGSIFLVTSSMILIFKNSSLTDRF